MTREPVAWVFNLDAEDELSHPGAHTPSKAVEARARALLPWLQRFLGAGDVIIWPELGMRGEGLAGRAWMPTRWAIETMRRHGVVVPAAPSMEVLRRVNHRRFAAQLSQALPGAAFVTSTEQLQAVLATAPKRTWLLKRPYGYAGKGRKRFTLEQLEAPWVQAGLDEGGLQVEPLVERLDDLGLHGWVEPGGELTLGRLTRQHIDDSGAWKASATTEHPALDELTAVATRTALALHAEGYFGPFGIDAFTWRHDGTTGLQPLSDLNARFSMGWPANGLQMGR